MRQKPWPATCETNFVSGTHCIISSRTRKIGSTSNSSAYVLPCIWHNLSPILAPDVVVIPAIGWYRLFFVYGHPVSPGRRALEPGYRLPRENRRQTIKDPPPVLPKFYR